MYKLDDPVGHVEVHRSRLNIGLVLITILSVLVASAALWLAWRNSKVLNCDDIVYDGFNQAKICEITIP